MTAQSWAQSPHHVTPDLVPVAGAQVLDPCPDPGCEKCRTAQVGARTLCRLVGFDFDVVDEHVQQHYRFIAFEVFASMADVLSRMRSETTVPPTEHTNPGEGS